MITRNRFIVALIALLALAPIHAQQEAVKKHPTTNEITEDLVIPSARTLTLNGAIAGTPTSLANAASWRTLLGAAAIGSANTFAAAQTFASSIMVLGGQTFFGGQTVNSNQTLNGLLNVPTQLFWMGVGGQASITSSGGRHGLIVRAPSGNGAAIVGWSSSGGSAVKIYQDTAYTSSALFVTRAASSTTPTAVITAVTGGTASHPMLQVWTPGTSTPVFSVFLDGSVSSLYQRFGAGSPEGAVVAPVGATYHRTNGGAGTSFYVKESGTGNTGWVAK